MADNVLNKRFFTNTYITGSGRHNYLRIDHLEDPLFTSFTFDIDYVTSPLFYTIGYSEYGYPNVEGLAKNIEEALSGMYAEYMSNDQGYDILPVFSASILDGNKLGFGLQQNVYMDLPLYGATEYIYMVDKRNGGANQNDAGYDSNQFLESGSNPNTLNSFKLGASLNSIVNDSDKAWAERKKQQSEDQKAVCEEIMKDPSVKNEHTQNENELKIALDACNNIKEPVNENGVDVYYNESELMDKVKQYEELANEFEYFKREIVAWVNETLSGYQSRGTAIYMENKCMQKIASYDSIENRETAEKRAAELEREFGKDFRERLLHIHEDSYAMKFLKLFNELDTCDGGYQYPKGKSDDGKSFLTDRVSGDGGTSVRETHIIDKFEDKLKYFDLLRDDKRGKDSIKGDFRVYGSKSIPDWATKFYSLATWFTGNSHDGYNYENLDEMIQSLMAYEADYETLFTENFTSDKIKQNEEMLDKYQMALDEIRTALYGFENGKPCDSSNPSPYSPYGEYLAAKEKCENDDYSQAEKSLKLAQSGVNQMTSMIGRDEYNQEIKDENYNESVKKDTQPLEVNRNKSIVTAQTVLDMLGFINGMKKMTMQYPYIIQGVSGLDTAYNKHYGIKDPYLGSGDDKITLTCLESLDLRVSSMFNRYFNAVYDRQYRRERVPVNLRRFNCSIYVHDVRNFMPKDRVDKNGEQIVTYNRLLELTDMYYSVIEFRFFDCEIVPEETGNIFNDVSNESPSEMKKTNFTFTYGNCVVNFVPPSEVAAHKTSKPRI